MISEKIRGKIACFSLMFLALSLSRTILYGQDPLYSQFFAAPLQLNPAFAGNSMGTAIHTNFRNQWPSLGQAYVTYSAAVDHFLDDYNSGVGLFMTSDNAGQGILRTFKFSGIYSYQVQLGSDFYTRLGIEAGFINTALDWSRLLFSDQIDPEFGLVSPGGIVVPSNELIPEDLSRTAFDASIGLLAYSSKYYFGISIRHINAPDLNFYRDVQNLANRGLPVRMVIHGGTEIVVSESPGRNPQAISYFSPNILYARQGSFQQLMIGSMYTYQQVFGGLWFRHTFANADAIVFTLGSKFDKFRIGYSYDFTVSGLLGVSGGSHEVSFSVLFPGKKNTRDYSDCFQLYR